MNYQWGTMIVSMDMLAGVLNEIDEAGSEIFSLYPVRDCMTHIIYRRPIKPVQQTKVKSQKKGKS
jgi:hypothetical protein